MRSCFEVFTCILWICIAIPCSFQTYTCSEEQPYECMECQANEKNNENDQNYNNCDFLLQERKQSTSLKQKYCVCIRDDCTKQCEQLKTDTCKLDEDEVDVCLLRPKDYKLNLEVSDKEGDECFNSAKENCDIDGGWSNWTISCVNHDSVTCGPYNATRTRTCDNPPKRFDGADCVGPSISNENVQCRETNPCPIDGEWSSWQFEDCKLGVQKLNRFCTNPKPQHGGKYCDDGVSGNTKTRKCKTLMQRRIGTAQKFNLPMEEYKKGFGIACTDYWLGLDKIYNITRKGSWSIHFEMKRFGDSQMYKAVYKRFSLEVDRNTYRVNIADFEANGNYLKAKNALTQSGGQGVRGCSINREDFVTTDVTQDTYLIKQIRKLGSPGWFIPNSPQCWLANPNGVYKTKKSEGLSNIFWWPLTESYESLEKMYIYLIPNDE